MQIHGTRIHAKMSACTTKHPPTLSFSLVLINELDQYYGTLPIHALPCQKSDWASYQTDNLLKFEPVCVICYLTSNEFILFLIGSNEGKVEHISFI